MQHDKAGVEDRVRAFGPRDSAGLRTRSTPMPFAVCSESSSRAARRVERKTADMESGIVERRHSMVVTAMSF